MMLDVFVRDALGSEGARKHNASAALMGSAASNADCQVSDVPAAASTSK